MTTSIVNIERVDGIAVLRVDNPPVNTIDARVREALSAAVGELESDRELRAAVLLCAGSTFFSGADMNEFAGPPKEEEYRRVVQPHRGTAVPGRGRDARHGDGRRPRDRAGLPLSHRSAARPASACRR